MRQREGAYGRFVVRPPSEEDAANDPVSITMYSIIDTAGTRDKPPATAERLDVGSHSQYPTCCYTHTWADAVFVWRLMNKGAEQR